MGFLDPLAGREKAGERDGGRKRNERRAGFALVERPGSFDRIQGKDGLLLPRVARSGITVCGRVARERVKGLKIWWTMDQKGSVIRVRGKGPIRSASCRRGGKAAKGVDSVLAGAGLVVGGERRIGARGQTTT